VVKIHLFRNGNGRHVRLLADLLLSKHFAREPFTWGGSAQLGTGDRYRQAYLEGLKAADRGDYGP
jgi:fido (protein-threonine AMPylation protein)